VVRSRATSSAEILFLRKQWAFYQEHQIKPRHLTEEARVSLAFWSQWFNWRESLVIVEPETLIRWHRKGFKLIGCRELPRDARLDFLRSAGRVSLVRGGAVVLGFEEDCSPVVLAKKSHGFLESFKDGDHLYIADAVWSRLGGVRFRRKQIPGGRRPRSFRTGDNRATRS
jgi:hypothetical protein